MNLSEAVNKVEHLANLYEAFKDLQEILTLARNAENQVVQLNARHEKLIASINAGHAEVLELTDRIEEAKASVRASEALAEKTRKDAEAEAEKILKQIRQNTADEITRLEAEEEKIREAFKANMLDLADQEVRKRAEIAALDTKIAELRGIAQKVLG